MLDLVIRDIHWEELLAAGFGKVGEVGEVALAGAGSCEEEEGGEEEVWGFHGKTFRV